MKFPTERSVESPNWNVQFVDSMSINRFFSLTVKSQSLILIGMGFINVIVVVRLFTISFAIALSESFRKVVSIFFPLPFKIARQHKIGWFEMERTGGYFNWYSFHCDKSVCYFCERIAIDVREHCLLSQWIRCVCDRHVAQCDDVTVHLVNNAIHEVVSVCWDSRVVKDGTCILNALFIKYESFN